MLEVRLLLSTTQSHRYRLCRILKEKGLDLETLAQKGKYISRDANKTLSGFMGKSIPNEQKCFELAPGILLQGQLLRLRANTAVLQLAESVALCSAHEAKYARHCG